MTSGTITKKEVVQKLFVKPCYGILKLGKEKTEHMYCYNTYEKRLEIIKAIESDPDAIYFTIAPSDMPVIWKDLEQETENLIRNYMLKTKYGHTTAS